MTSSYRRSKFKGLPRIYRWMSRLALASGLLKLMELEIRKIPDRGGQILLSISTKIPGLKASPTRNRPWARRVILDVCCLALSAIWLTIHRRRHHHHHHHHHRRCRRRHHHHHRHHRHHRHRHHHHRRRHHHHRHHHHYHRGIGIFLGIIIIINDWQYCNRILLWLIVISWLKSS